MRFVWGKGAQTFPTNATGSGNQGDKNTGSNNFGSKNSGAYAGWRSVEHCQNTLTPGNNNLGSGVTDNNQINP